MVEILNGFPERVAQFGKPAGITDVWGLNTPPGGETLGYRFINIGTIAHLGLDGATDAFERLRSGQGG
ncbi:MAG: hypothetical protein CM1200mP2_54710 [Planctomycetaceae bacterium]|nr:MAG: hypothetical protein CM1200mP2_54710 [Planctomycetaceae bacterium]